MRIILGSQSPRRRELLGGLSIPFEVVCIEADESFPTELQGADIPVYIARAKARAYKEQLQDNELLITSDTIVWIGNEENSCGQMLGKPKDNAEAKQMLRLLSGNTHQVYTAVCFATCRNGEYQCDTLVDKTDVTFRQLQDEEIDYYVEQHKPLDKAGAYGIQEWIGYIGCTELRGSYFNVMGFPTERVYTYLAKHYNEVLLK